MKVFLIDYKFNGIGHVRVLQAKSDEDAINFVMTDCRGAKIIAVR